jgi:hypothetical protein
MALAERVSNILEKERSSEIVSARRPVADRPPAGLSLQPLSQLIANATQLYFEQTLRQKLYLSLPLKHLVEISFPVLLSHSAKG